MRFKTIDVKSLPSLGFAPVEPQRPQPPSRELGPVSSPTKNPFLRCPITQIWQSNSDSLRQVYTAIVPQRRIFIAQ